MTEADKVWENQVNSVIGFWKGFKREGDKQVNTNMNLSDATFYSGVFVLGIIFVTFALMFTIQ